MYLVLPVFAPVDKLKVRANGGGLIFDLAAVAVFYSLSLSFREEGCEACLCERRGAFCGCCAVAGVR